MATKAPAAPPAPAQDGPIETVSFASLGIKIGGRSARKGTELIPVKDLIGETITIRKLNPRTRKGAITGYTADTRTADGELLAVKLTERLEDAMIEAFRQKPNAQFTVKVVAVGKRGVSFA